MPRILTEKRMEFHVLFLKTVFGSWCGYAISIKTLGTLCYFFLFFSTHIRTNQILLSWINWSSETIVGQAHTFHGIWNDLHHEERLFGWTHLANDLAFSSLLTFKCEVFLLCTLRMVHSWLHFHPYGILIALWPRPMVNCAAHECCTEATKCLLLE